MALAHWQRTIVDGQGNVVPGAIVEVRDEESGNLAALKSDRAGLVSKSNPFFADGSGFADFYAAGGAYKITATSGAMSQVWRYAAIGTAAEKDISQISVSVSTLEFVIGDGVSTITTGMKGVLNIKFTCAITGVTLLADQTGSIVVDLFKTSYADYDPPSHPASIDKITASAPPTISSAKKSSDETLTGWATALNAGDVLAFNVNSVTDHTRVTVSLTVQAL